MSNSPAKKKVTLTLVGVDGNIFAVLAAFKRRAAVENWKREETAAVVSAALKAPDYDHALMIIMEHCQEP